VSQKYLTPLPRLLASGLTQVLNRMLRHDPGAQRRLAPLRQRTLAIGLRGLAIDLYFTVDQEQFIVSLSSDSEPDTWLRGTPPALAGMAAPSSGARPGAVQIQGDAELARAYQAFFQQLDPDWEESLAQRFGDVIGHRLAMMIKSVRAGLNQFGKDGAAMTRDYLHEEAELLVCREDMDGFLEAVDEIRDDVDRLAARIERLRPSRP